MAFNDYVTTKKSPPTKEVCPPVNFFQPKPNRGFLKLTNRFFIIRRTRSGIEEEITRSISKFL